MPIKKENLAKYPPPREWAAIRDRILERAGNRCEKCGVSGRAIGYREKDGSFVQLAASREDVGMEVEVASLDGHKVVEIVLTIAHLDHDPTNSDESNLRAWCQRDHLCYDAELHAENAARTRSEKKRTAATVAGQAVLLESAAS